MITYTFMNKNVELFDIEMDRGQVESIFNVRVENRHLLPVFLLPKKNMGISKRDFNDWWRGRRIPASRTGIKELLWKLDGLDLDELAEKSLGLSLSDQYWIRPEDDIKWKDVNFFENDFSEDIGKLLISGEWNNGDLKSPDNTSDGVVKKRWKIINGERCLVKGSFGPPWYTQPFREVFAAQIAELLLQPYEKGYVVPYTLIWEDDIVYSVCPNFITTDTEYISFNQINNTYKKSNNMSSYEFCKHIYHLDKYVLDLMLILDFIVLNEDRHYGNFGFIRDTNTGEFLRAAPIFDTGSSLFYDSTHCNTTRIESKPFSTNFKKQLSLVDCNSYKDSILLVKDNYKDIFNNVFAKSSEDQQRKEKLLRAVGEQIDLVFNER